MLKFIKNSVINVLDLLINVKEILIFCNKTSQYFSRPRQYPHLQGFFGQNPPLFAGRSRPSLIDFNIAPLFCGNPFPQVTLHRIFKFNGQGHDVYRPRCGFWICECAIDPTLI